MPEGSEPHVCLSRAGLLAVAVVNRLDEFGQRHADLVAGGDHHFAARDEHIVGEDFNRVGGALFEFHDGAAVNRALV